MKKIGLFIALAIAGALAFAAVKWYSNKNAEVKEEQQTELLINQEEQKEESVQATSADSTEPSNQNNPALSKWKTYTNDKLGITFQYPDTWLKNGEDVNVTDLSGATTAIQINFIDTVSKTTLLIAYHLAPAGADIFSYKNSQYSSSQGWYEKDAKEIEVAEKKAIVASRKLTISGKGNPLNPPIKSIIVDLLDKPQTGEIEFQFQTPATNEDSEVAMFNQLLSSFKFTN